MKLCVLVLLVLVSLTEARKSPLKRKQKPICRDLVEPQGIKCETHIVETEDEYLLQLIHLPNPGGQVVYLQHGLLSSSAAWLNVKTSFGNYLWSKGFDVWAGDSRGNDYSLRNRHLKPTEDAFWNAIDWDEMARYDLKAFVNFILAETKTEKLIYVGHSQGTTQAFAAFSRNYDELETKVKLYVALAPVVFLKHQGSKLMSDLAALHADVLLNLYGKQAFPPTNMSAVTVLEKVGAKCPNTNDPLLCENIMYDLEGASLPFLNMNITQLQNLLGFDACGTSMRNLKHWIEHVRYDRFSEYGYGWLGNLEHYGTAEPPAYDISKINVPTVFGVGGKDNFTRPTDVDHLMRDYKDAKIVKRFDFPDWEHNDFVWSELAPKDLYDPLIEIFKQY